MPTTDNSPNNSLTRELARDIVRLIDRGPKFNCAACGQRYDIDNLDFCEQCLYPICGSCTVAKRVKQAARTVDRCPRCPGELRSIDRLLAQVQVQFPDLLPPLEEMPPPILSPATVKMNRAPTAEELQAVFSEILLGAKVVANGARFALDLSMNRKAPVAIERLANEPDLFFVSKLNLSASRLHDEDVEKLLKSGYLIHLEALDLSLNNLTDRVTSLLASHPSLRHLVTLKLFGNTISAEGAAQLWDNGHSRFWLRELQELSLGAEWAGKMPPHLRPAK